MSKHPTWLLEHRGNVHSQRGEDGIIAKILETIADTDKHCVEFGAWDGLHLSNTRYLILEQGYSAVLIEADRDRFADLQRTYADHEQVTTLNRLVGFTAEDGLDQILDATPIPTDFDLLSIDIDGNDYHVWRAVQRYRPKVVVIEFNPTIPTPVRFVQPADPRVSQGASLLSLVELGTSKGYELVSVTEFNAFFVRHEYFEAFEISSNSPEVLRTHLEAVTYVFSGYDGRVLLQGRCELLWHGVKLKPSAMQPLPSFLRAYPGNYSALQRTAFALFLLFTDPRRAFRKVGELTGLSRKRSG